MFISSALRPFVRWKPDGVPIPQGSLTLMHRFIESGTHFSGLNKGEKILCQFLAATKQLYEWFEVRPSVRLSVRHTILTMFPSSYHHEIFRSYYQWQKWRPCKRSRSKVKVTEVITQLNRSRTVAPVWIHIWWWNDAYSLIMIRRGALLFFQGHPSNLKVTRLKTSILTQIVRFRTVTPVWIHQWLWNSAQSLK